MPPEVLARKGGLHYDADKTWPAAGGV